MTKDRHAVVLKTVAPREAIITKIPERLAGEREYLVDRRRLSCVEVIEHIGTSTNEKKLMVLAIPTLLEGNCDH
jgi:hypothetical protein